VGWMSKISAIFRATCAISLFHVFRSAIRFFGVNIGSRRHSKQGTYMLIHLNIHTPQSKVWSVFRAINEFGSSLLVHCKISVFKKYGARNVI
jgi:hypothetical protein